MTGPGTAQQNCVLEMPNTNRHKEKTHECNPWATLQSEGKYHQTPNYKHKRKKTHICAENVDKDSIGSRISGLQSCLSGSSPERAGNGPAKLYHREARTNTHKGNTPCV